MAMNKNDYNRRFGAPPINNIGFVFFGLMSLLSLVGVFIACFFYHWAVLGLLICVVVLIKTILPFFEKFTVAKNIIKIKKHKYTEQKEITADTIFIISYTIAEDIVLKDRYMVNIVRSEVYEAFNILHEDLLQNQIDATYRFGKYKKAIYQNSYIEAHFKHRFIYSFVYEKDFANKFFSEQKKPVI